jgi:KaiC/GvpD/RAD55 family RecA-like ATPase
MERENIGVSEIDSMIQGGLPKGSVVGLSGPPGVGKSIMSLHFLLEGARKGQKCVYVNLEEPRNNINNLINQFEFSKEFKDFEKKGLIVVKCFTYQEYEKITLDLLEKVRESQKVGRLIIDSFNCFFSSIDNPASPYSDINVRKLITSSFFKLRKRGLTVLLILEKQDDSGKTFDYHIPYFLDGMIKLDFLDLGTIERRVFIPKMRWTNQYKESKPYEIGKKGIEMIEED